MQSQGESNRSNNKRTNAKKIAKNVEKPFPALTSKKLAFWRSEAARLQALVDEGDASALWKLARLYEDGRGVKRNWKKAFALRSRAADAGDPNGLAWVGYSFDYGIGAPYDPKRSFEYYLNSLKTKNFESRGVALAGIGWGYFNGEGTAIDPKKAFDAFWEARDSDVGFVSMGLADCYRNGVCVEKDDAQDQFWAKKAFDAWSRESALGNAVALDYLAGLYASGRGVEPNRDRAFDASLVAARAGYGSALYHAALNYEYLKDDPQKAFEYYHKSAEKGVPEAFFHVGLAFLTGDGTEANFEKAFRAFRRGAELGQGYAQFWLGRCYWNGWGRRRDEARAVDCWRRGAEAGCAPSQNQYAEYLETDGAAKNGGKIDWNEATRLRLAAARQGLPDAQLAVGYAFNNGLGVEKDPKEAVFWYRQAATSGESPGAKYNLAICLEEGDGVEPDPDEALRLMEESADDGWAPAQNALGVKLYSGEDGKRDRVRAARFFGAAAAQGYVPALAGFSKCLRAGIGVAKNPEAAEFFLRLAAESDPFAAGALGERFADGDGVERNPRFAAHWFKKAADGGNPDGARRLAFCFWEGDGVERDRAKAIEYWSRAAETGDFDALEELARADAAKTVAEYFADDADFAPNGGPSDAPNGDAGR